MNTKVLKAPDLSAFLDAVLKSRRLVAPRRDGDLIDFREVRSPGEIAPSRDYVNPRTSVKRFFFPRSEPLVRFARSKDGVTLEEPQTSFPPTVLFGCRPCDASSLPIMDALYQWDYIDSFWFKRREATAVVAVSCVRADESCFCTALGGAPNATTGSDLLLTPLNVDRPAGAEQDPPRRGGLQPAGESFLVEVLTPKGEALVALAPNIFADGSGDNQAASREAFATLPPKLDLDAIAAWLAKNFENPRWAPSSYKCWGCGCCTFLCPTCHCFDIVDEGTLRHGQRRRNWDACQFATFTLHASGHNPRPDQAARWRQRVEHKFNYYVQKFNVRSCVGCGRCIRHCPVNMNIYAQLREIAAL